MEQSGGSTSHKRPREEGNGHSNGVKQEESGASVAIKSENHDNDHALPHSKNTTSNNNNAQVKHEPATSNNNNEQVKGEQEPAPPERKKIKQSMRCPYLDTVNRHMLDFDFERLCSVSLSNLNVYACLVCGKYFQGRGKTSHAHYHSLQANHHVFINLANKKIYCLPDDYEVIDSSLDDVKYLLDPTFTKEQVRNLDRNVTLSRCLDKTEYLPGIVGLNNIKMTDYINAVLQALVHIPPLRDYFIVEENLAHTKSELVHRFGMLVRKMWNPRNYKAQVSPHELLQAIQDSSNKKFKIGVQSDPLDFLQWFLNALHLDLGGTKRANSSIIYQTFQGEVQVITETPVKKTEKEKKKNEPVEEQFDSTTKVVPFLFLSLEIPATPLFKDEQEKNIIPQIPLFGILNKFDGHTIHDVVTTGERKRYLITKLPRYLTLHIKRFAKNNWFIEKNPTIVNFPLKSLDMKEYSQAQQPARYDLLANIKHEGLPKQGSYSVHVQNKGNEKWFDMQDLIVKPVAEPYSISVSEAYLQFYESKAV